MQEKKAKQNKKRFWLATMLIVLAVAAASSTIAYVMATADRVTNSFERAEMDCEITEEFDGTIKKNVAIKNTSTQDDVAGYIRAAVVVSWENELGVVYAKTPKAGEDYTIEYGTGWEKEGDYYYWPAEVAAGSSTGDLIVTCQPVAGQTPEGYTLVVDILAQIIQSNPKDAVIDAWGYDPGSEG